MFFKYRSYIYMWIWVFFFDTVLLKITNRSNAFNLNKDIWDNLLSKTLKFSLHNFVDIITQKTFISIRHPGGAVNRFGEFSLKYYQIE